MKEIDILSCFFFKLDVIQKKKIFILSLCTDSGEIRPIIFSEGLHN